MINLRLDVDEAKILRELLNGRYLNSAEKREIQEVLPHLEHILDQDHGITYK